MAFSPCTGSTHLISAAAAALLSTLTQHPTGASLEQLWAGLGGDDAAGADGAAVGARGHRDGADLTEDDSAMLLELLDALVRARLAERLAS